ncbi:translation initiation factor-like protein IF-2 [Macroventuria anomochaeta]|uniref:Translation initiation factor-like protein IF-2 n=1 Tax=Macroventuria anomochaeta TaxID=301207 RepID=A0ACB6S7M2_9PLEO|nr:translation initiation factor-like protein IF-2 [Macroventuria anomochaeta]KAF2630002.1 translation initiation factor-like protein IF-2 [Macroventuria anomochaeta]
MRRAQGLRVSSTRDICIFCATRQLATANAPLPTTSTQRRYLNSSSRVSQAEAQLFKSDDAPARPLTQAERMRKALLASSTAAPAALQSPQGGYMSPAQRARATLGAQESPRSQSPAQRQPQQDRRAPNRGGLFDGMGRDQNRSAPMARRVGNDGRFDSRPAQRDRFRVNMDSKPQFDTPSFGSGHLRRRNEPQFELAQAFQDQHRRPPVRATPSRGKLDQSELDKLLGNNTSQTRSSRPYQPLARNSNAQRKCFNCGSPDHMSAACPNKPTFRERPNAQRSTTGGTTTYQPPQSNRTTTYQPAQATPESLADAANEWVSKRASKLEVEPQSYQAEEEWDNKRRDVEKERRRRRFEIDDEPTEVRNRYEEPERRRAGGRNSRRVMRDAEEDDIEDRFINKKEQKRLRKEAKKAARLEKAEPTPITLPEYISVANLAGMLRLRVEDFVTKLEELGFEDVQATQVLNAEHAGLIAQEYNFEPTFLGEHEDGDLYAAPEITPEEYAELPVRPPVVTIMGHVDHGKTTILDYMRSTSVAAGEFGGITQHIGAFSVPLANGKQITFLDTPGHSAFETMRARGANVTDIVVLVVAADDSVMPQTVEAIKHAQAAKVPIIVAINKMDKQQADPDAVKLDLGRHGIEVEDFGGDVQAIPVSGKTGQGIPDLEEAISTLSELLDHRADPQANVEGTVLEGTTKKSGRVATVLVRSGTLRQGTALVAGTTWTRVRSLRNGAGVMVKEAGPGIAVEVDGWRDQPIAGDEVLQAGDEQQATSVSQLRTEKLEREQMAKDMEAINVARREEAERREAEAAKQAIEGGEAPTEEIKDKSPEVVSFIIKGDVSGSVEAIIDSISALGNAEVSTRILRHGVGPPSEFDIQHAADAQGHIVNFNTTIPAHVSKLAEEKVVRIFDSNIIYRTVEMVKDLLSEKLAPSIIQKVTGEVEIAAVFEIGLGGKKKMKVAGSKVRNGVVERGSKARVLRNDTIIHDGTIDNIKNQKKDVESMRKDTECGISFAGWEDFKIGDKIQCYEETQQKRTL